MLCRQTGTDTFRFWDAGADAVYLDFEDLRDYAAGVKAVRQHADSIPVFLATPRIQKPSETGYFKLMERRSRTASSSATWARRNTSAIPPCAALGIFP